MISRYIVTLNGISLESLHPAIVITDVQYPNVEYQRESIGSVKRDGARIYRSYKEKSEVAVKFMVREYDISSRQSICMSICEWAKNGGRLMINDRQLKFLDCLTDSLPGIDSAKNWADELTIVFAAYNIPYWQDVVPTEMRPPTARQHSVSKLVPGNAPWTFVEALVVPEETMTHASFGIFCDASGATNDHKLFNVLGVSVPAGHTFRVGYSASGILEIQDNDTTLLAYHQGKDDLIAVCGSVNEFRFGSNCKCAVTYRFRGNWE